jgi:hypothetical protein
MSTRTGRIRLTILARAAIRRGRPTELAAKEARLLKRARAARSRDESRLWLVLVACSWASDPLNDLVRRDAALLAAVAISATVEADLRRAAGIDEALAQLTRCGALDAGGRELAYALASGLAPHGIARRVEALFLKLWANPAHARLTRSGAWHHRGT